MLETLSWVGNFMLDGLRRRIFENMEGKSGSITEVYGRVEGSSSHEEVN